MFKLAISFLLFSAITIHAAPSLQPVAAKHGMVVTEQHYASEVGANILASGGNAIDAAVAVAYALAVVNPCCGNLGGGGFMTIHLKNGKNSFINFREKAPLAAKSDMFLDPEKSLSGYTAVAVPGTVLGLETALNQFGTMKRQRVISPAIALAEKGFLLTENEAKLLASYAETFKSQPNVTAIFLKKNGRPYKAGERLIQIDLANTLKLIREKGADVFYKGKISEDIVKASQAHGGILSLKDFAEYKVEVMSPLRCTYHDYTIISAPPPSSGGTTLCEILNIIEPYPLRSYGFHSAKSTHYIVEAMRYAFYDRNNHLGDPNFVTNPVEHLISKDYAEQIQTQILDVKATPSNDLGDRPKLEEGVNTTHYSIIDKYGNAVSVTYTLNGFFGAGVIAGKTGFFLNNEMNDFTIDPNTPNKFGLVQGSKNKIEPGKRPLSSMTPTIMMKDNRVIMIVGSPGGPKIITSTLLTILNVLAYGLNIQEAVDAARFHHQWLPDTIQMEPFAFSKENINQLNKMGYHFSQEKPWGAVEAIYIDPKTHIIYGGSDKRRPAGAAVGI